MRRVILPNKNKNPAENVNVIEETVTGVQRETTDCSGTSAKWGDVVAEVK